MHSRVMAAMRASIQRFGAGPPQRRPPRYGRFGVARFRLFMLVPLAAMLFIAHTVDFDIFPNRRGTQVEPVRVTLCSRANRRTVSSTATRSLSGLQHSSSRDRRAQRMAPNASPSGRSVCARPTGCSNCQRRAVRGRATGTARHRQIGRKLRTSGAQRPLARRHSDRRGSGAALGRARHSWCG